MSTRPKQTIDEMRENILRWAQVPSHRQTRELRCGICLHRGLTPCRVGLAALTVMGVPDVLLSKRHGRKSPKRKQIFPGFPVIEMRGREELVQATRWPIEVKCRRGHPLRLTLFEFERLWRTGGHGEPIFLVG
jgi:hypothetical protein